MALDIPGLVFGALGTYGIFHLLFAAIRQNLPNQRIEALEQTVSETYRIFHYSVQQNLFHDLDYVRDQEYHLRRSTEALNTLRIKAHCSPGFLGQLCAMLRGLSHSISSVEKEVKSHRTLIASTSEKMRQQLAMAGQLHETASCSSAQEETETSCNPFSSLRRTSKRKSHQHSLGTYPSPPVPQSTIWSSSASTRVIKPPLYTQPSTSSTLHSVSPPSTYDAGCGDTLPCPFEASLPARSLSIPSPMSTNPSMFSYSRTLSQTHCQMSHVGLPAFGEPTPIVPGSALPGYYDYGPRSSQRAYPGLYEWWQSDNASNPMPYHCGISHGNFELLSILSRIAQRSDATSSGEVNSQQHCQVGAPTKWILQTHYDMPLASTKPRWKRSS
ncbi:hypothetical protein K474DRAFT_1771958 [Panus rudis PR-1116 ss-1]|nr:hypothetical protein K474DRAFT_1771958 [Panus rudis PR-1116 ss-1]